MTNKEQMSRGEALAKVAALEAELAKTQKREADTDKQLHALRKSIASTSTGVGDEKHQDALGEWETVLERINERYEFRAAPAPVERVEQESVATVRYGGYTAGNYLEWSRGAGLQFLAEGQKLYVGQANPPRIVAYLDIGAGGYIDLGSDLEGGELESLPFGRHVLGIVGTYGADGYVPATPQPAPTAAQDVAGLVEALKECAASLAWNCFGECRAIHEGPIIPAAGALEMARAALAAHQSGGAK